jgi:hypothetical protein
MFVHQVTLSQCREVGEGLYPQSSMFVHQVTLSQCSVFWSLEREASKFTAGTKLKYQRGSL